MSRCERCGQLLTNLIAVGVHEDVNVELCGNCITRNIRISLLNSSGKVLMSELCEIATKYGTDKGPKNHNYTPYYDAIFRTRKIRKVVELGIAGGESLRTWKEYFPMAEVWGADNDLNSLFEEDRIKSILCDQSSISDLMNLVKTVKFPVDVIIDDASHKAEDQIFTALFLSQHMAVNNLYIIEDVSKESREKVYNTLYSSLNPDFRISMIETADPRTDSRLIVLEKI